MTMFNEYSDEELQQELERRRNKKARKPKPVENPDFSTLIETCQKNIDFLVTEGGDDSDWEYWIYEAAMEAVFGKVVWDWINERVR